MPFIIVSLLTALPASASEPHGVALLYHRFEENDYPSTNIRLAQFQAQLDYLHREGFTIWPLRRLLDAIFSNQPVPDKAVSLTVDDAYLSVYRYAFPAVRKRKLPMTVFVSTDAVDRRLGGYMSWAQMREMQRFGVDFANHGSTHAHLHERREEESEEAWQQRVEADIRHAQQRLDAELGDQGMKLFAYPYGEFSCDLGRVVRRMGYLGIGQQSGAIGPASRKEALPRFPMNERYAVLEEFALKVASLPLPLQRQWPLEPQLQDGNPPTLLLTLPPDRTALAESLRCFLGNGVRLETVMRRDGRIAIRAASPLPPGRSRYNCTAPAGAQRYYWFSQPWQNGPDAADPAR